MSEKRDCPACNSCTSDNWRAFRDGEPCPHCGLPAGAAREIEAAMQRGADESLAQRAAKAEARATAAERDAANLRAALGAIRRITGDPRGPR